MKKETRIKDLKVDLIKLLINELNFNEPFRDVLECDAMPFLKIIDWTKATDAERLAYCEVRYMGELNVKYPDVPSIEPKKIFGNKFHVGFGECIYSTMSGYEVYNKKNNSFAEIIEEVEKEPEFEVGKFFKFESPSIKDRLKGTCVLNESVEMGAEIVALYTEGGFNPLGLTGEAVGRYYGTQDDLMIQLKNPCEFKSILSLDQLREIVRGEKAPENFNNKCLIEAFSEVPDLSQPVEFKEGEMVEVYLEGTWCERKYAFFVSGEHWYYNLSINNTVHIADEIRKIDPDKELKELADEVIVSYKDAFAFDIKDVEMYQVRDVKSMLIEMGKKVQAFFKD